MHIKKLITSSLKALVVIYFLVLVSMFFLQEKLLFHPQKTPLDYKYEFMNTFEERFISVDGVKIHSLYFSAKNSKGLILYFHGNGCELRQCGFTADELASRINYDVWIVDYPGYGKSEGSIQSEDQLHRVADAIFAEANQIMKLRDPKKIILFGRSLGSGIATKLASQKDIQALILETPYFSIKDLALSKYPFVPPFVLKYNFRSDLYAQNFKAPVLIFHGDQDQLIPIEQARRLSKMIKNLSFIEISDGTHDDLASFPNYWAELDLFIRNLK